MPRDALGLLIIGLIALVAAIAAARWSKGSKRELMSAKRRNDSTLVSHTLFVDGHRTTMRLEPMMWEALEDVADRLGVTIHEVATNIERERTASSLSAGVRLYIVNFYRRILREQR